MPRVVVKVLQEPIEKWQQVRGVLAFRAGGGCEIHRLHGGGNDRRFARPIGKESRCFENAGFLLAPAIMSVADVIGEGEAHLRIALVAEFTDH